MAQSKTDETARFDAIVIGAGISGLWQESEIITGLALLVENAAKDWDGKDPVRIASL